MQNELINHAASGLVNSDRIERLVQDFLAGRKATTLRTYSQGLADFARFVDGASKSSGASLIDGRGIVVDGASALNSAARRLLSLSRGEANHIVLQYRSDMVERGLAPNTINARLAAVRSLVKLGRTLGLVDWSIDIQNVKVQSYRDTAGPGHHGYRLLISELERNGKIKAVRDLAIVRLLFDRALRRAEVCSLDLEHVDLDRSRVAVLGKGASQREWLTIAEPTKAALAGWLERRGHQPGPVFTNLDRARKGNGRITGEAVRRLVQRLGDRIGQRVRPHGLRHAAVTVALDRTGGDVRAVQKFSRHANVQTVLRYDDNRTDKGGEITRIVAAS